MMEFSLSQEQRALRDEIVRFARKELNDGVAERDRAAEFSRDGWNACGEMGLTGLPVPEEFGGHGLDPLSTAVALEAFGYGCHDGGLVFSVCAHLLSCVVPIWKHGTDAQRSRYLPGLCQGRLIGVHAMTEPDSGSDAFALRTRAAADGDGYRLNGSKIFITNGPVADLVIVFAMTDAAKGYHGGVSAFLVEKGTDGFRASQKFQKLGLRTSPLGELVFENAWVPADAVLGGIGGGSALFNDAMDWERVCLFASHLGTMQRLLEQAVKQARTRKQFGQTIGKFQAISHKIVDMRVRLEAARLLTYRAASRLDSAPDVAVDASMAKLLVSESFVRAALDTLQVFGGYGFLEDYDVERIVRDALGSTLYSGTSEMQRNIIARWMGM